MIVYSFFHRVQYYETDQMQVVHHSNYFRFFETARTEMLRKMGVSYKELEDSKIQLPIIEMYSKCLSPAYYDDLLEVKIVLKKLPQVKIVFEYEVYNQNKVLINKANTVLAFMDSTKNRPTKVPDYLLQIFQDNFVVSGD